jgi:hypothetical protein
MDMTIQQMEKTAQPARKTMMYSINLIFLLISGWALDKGQCRSFHETVDFC